MEVMDLKTRRVLTLYGVLLWVSLMVACTTSTPDATLTATPTTVPETPLTGAVARLNTTADEVTAGKTLGVDIVIENVTQLYGVELRLAFNPVQLKVVDADAEMAGVQITCGGFLSSDYVVENQVDNDTGTVTYVLMQVAPTKPVSGDGTLATLALRSKTSGKLDISISGLLLSDAGGNQIPVTVVREW